jgi:hypothetical protein
MNDQHLSGKWIGSYTYGEEYDEPVRGKTVPFELNLTVINGSIKGECTDGETTAHFEKPATVEGAVLDNSIKFIKRYPYYWQNEKGCRRFLPKLPSQEVNYSGRLVNGQFEGEWEIVTRLQDAQGEKISYKGYGSWIMKKEQISDFEI